VELWLNFSTATPFAAKFGGGCFGLSPSKKVHFLLDSTPPLWYNVPMKHIINLYSRFIGYRFAKSWNKLNNSNKSLRLLKRYIALRQRLPKVTHTSILGETRSAHWGNHVGSKRKPYKATQGF